MRIKNVILGLSPAAIGNGLEVDVFGVPPSLLTSLQQAGMAVDSLMGDTYVEFYTKVCIHQAEGGMADPQEVVMAGSSPDGQRGIM
ncbi:MAG: hypothetical protein WC291_10115 [Thermodesulfovibrionales bacterium]|jgi:hypothetical protein